MYPRCFPNEDQCHPIDVMYMCEFCLSFHSEKGEYKVRVNIQYVAKTSSHNIGSNEYENLHTILSGRSLTPFTLNIVFTL